MSDFTDVLYKLNKYKENIIIPYKYYELLGGNTSLSHFLYFPPISTNNKVKETTSVK